MAEQERIDELVSIAIKISAGTYGEVLDFSDESIDIVDTILDGYHDRYLHPEKDESLIRSRSNTFAHIFGAYVGEVLLRNHATDYNWQETDHVWVISNDKNYISPITKALKQIEDGKESGDDIASFFDVAIHIIRGDFQKKDKTI